jgi:hypothetical protein
MLRSTFVESACSFFTFSNVYLTRPFMTSRLNPEDQKHVEAYLQLPQHQVERRPFRPWMLLVLVLAVTIGLGLLSRLISYLTL